VTLIRALMLAIALLASLASSTVQAHPLAPVGLHIQELQPGTVSLRLKRALVQPRRASFVLQLPARCSPAGPSRIETTDKHAVEHMELACGEQPLSGAVFGLSGLKEASVDAVVVVELADGQRHRALLSGARNTFRVPAVARSSDTALGYLRLGVEHILGGVDHLLFVLGLLLLVASRRRAIIALTAFTAGHSITLCAAALGYLSVPAELVEVAIAVSLMVVGAQIIHSGPNGNLRHLWLTAAVFGLLHGLGFAGALTATGLPQGDIPLALASFNVGVEVGQITFVLAASLVAFAARRYLPESALLRRRLPGYVIGSLAGMWCVERALQAVTG